MNVREALESGYTVGDVKYFQGYVSRKVVVMDQPVLTAGGYRKGQLYYECPNYNSTRYSLRVYLVKEK